MSFNKTACLMVALVVALAVGAGAWAGFGLGLSGAVKNKTKKMDEKVTAKIEEEEAAAARQNQTHVYTNADINGPWFSMLSGGGEIYKLYIIADGAGTVTDYGAFNLPNPAGIYSVQAGGKLSVTLYQSSGDPAIIIVGQMSSRTEGDTQAFEAGTGMLLGAGAMTKVSDTAACAGSWTGGLTRTSPSESKPVSMTVNENGVVTGASGLAATVAGRFYAVNGHVAGMIRTGEADAWNQVQFEGTLTGNTMSGSIALDASSPNGAGTYALTRP